MRENSIIKNSYFYGIFFMIMLLVFEFLPLVLFSFNAKFLVSNQVALSPLKQSQYPIRSQFEK